MVEPAGGQRLALGPRRVAAAAGRDHLDRDGALEPLVGRGVDRPEPARAEALAEPVAVQDEVRRERSRELVRDLHCRRFRCNGVIPSDRPVILGRPVAAEETRTLSFFDEDDEPTRTTSRTRTQTRVRPRAGRVSGAGSPPDSQALLVRRMVAVVAGAVVLFALFFVVRSCNDSRTDNALKDYNRSVAGIATESRQTGESLFAALGAAGEGSPSDLYQQIVGMQATSRKSLEQAQNLSVPGDMVRRAAGPADRAGAPARRRWRRSARRSSRRWATRARRPIARSSRSPARTRPSTPRT